MKIHEYQGKEVLRQFGVPVPRGIPAFTVQEAVEAAQKLGGPVWVVKAQIHAGGRGKGGGVKVAKSIEDVKASWPSQILGMQLVTHQTGPEGQKVRRLLYRRRRRHPEGVLRVLRDRPRHAEGGLHRQPKAAWTSRKWRTATPEKIIKVFVDPATGLTRPTGRDELAAGIGMPADSPAQAVDVFKKLYTCYMETDASAWSRSTR
jgi:succinyl-CoA synthetase beta subunit